MKDTVLITFAALAGPLAAIAPVTWILHFFVALRSTPTRRAAWTVVPSYVIVAVLLTFSIPAEDAWAVPLASIPAALIAFWFWRRDFREAWVISVDHLPEGTKLANDDWVAGLMFVAAILGLAVLRALLHLFLRGHL